MPSPILSRSRLLIAALALAGSPALAREASSSSQEKAKATYEQSQRAFRNHSYDEALKLTLQAYREFPSPGFLINAAMCQRQLGNPREAERYLMQYEQKTKGKGVDVTPLLAALKREGTAKSKPKSDSPKMDSIDAPVQVRDYDSIAAVGDPKGVAAYLRPTPSDGSVPSNVLNLASDPAPAYSAAARPLYKEWWFWTVIGAAAAGSAFGIAAASNMGSYPASL